jgi:hypothetical protein
MLRRITDDLAELAALAATDDDVGFHLRRIKFDAVGLGTIHDAEATALLGDTTLIFYIRNVIHIRVLPLHSSGSAHV